MTEPAVSVVMPVYNGAEFLREALASIRWQTFSQWELICINDGSTDSSAAILEEYTAADPRIRVIHQENQGIVAALNRGLTAARAPWIARMDCDDIALPERLEVQRRFAQHNPRVIAVGSNVLSIDPEGWPVATGEFATDHAEIHRRLLDGSGGTLSHSTVLMQLAAVRDAGLYRANYEWVEDTDLWLRLARRGSLANIPKVLLHYRLHEGSVCWNRRAAQRERLAKLLAEANAELGLPAPHERLDRLRKPKHLSSAAGKWARQAIRAGNFQTALKHCRRMWRAEPLTWSTLRVSLEMVLRGSIALLHPQPRHTPLPDWRRWDPTFSSQLPYTLRAA